VTRAVLIVGQEDDLHVRAVTEAIERRGGESALLDPYRTGEEASRLAYGFAGGERSAAVRAGRRWIDLRDVGAVWWRMKLLSGVSLITAGPAAQSDFVLREWRSALDSLDAFTPNAAWVNPRAADQSARHKPLQLACAQELGLAVPDTLVSNDPPAVAALMRSGGEHIYKVLTWYFEVPDRMVFTSLVDETAVRDDPAAVATAPGIYQARIAKRHEIRATVVGERVFAVRVESQASDRTELDWRRDQYGVAYHAARLDPELDATLVAMNERLGLAFGAYDLIVTPAGEPVFLEVNPMGQWLWLERAAGVPITAAVADHLLSCSRIAA
jgi:glutathione synthase/RimK-type ligase-like ATP-grasp enzyme